MAEWSIAAVLKTANPKGFRGSNPLLSSRSEAWAESAFSPRPFYNTAMSRLFLGLILPFIHAVASVPRSAVDGSLSVSGDGVKAVTMTVDDLAKLEHVRVKVREKDGSDSAYEGALVFDVLKKAGLRMGDHPGKAMSAYAAVSASDDYQVVFGLGELAPQISGRTIVLAYRMNGKPLGTGVGPFRVVVAEDKARARSIRMVTQIELVQLRK